MKRLVLIPFLMLGACGDEDNDRVTDIYAPTTHCEKQCCEKEDCCKCKDVCQTPEPKPVPVPYPPAPAYPVPAEPQGQKQKQTQDTDVTVIVNGEKYCAEPVPPKSTDDCPDCPPTCTQVNNNNNNNNNGGNNNNNNNNNNNR